MAHKLTGLLAGRSLGLLVTIAFFCSWPRATQLAAPDQLLQQSSIKAQEEVAAIQVQSSSANYRLDPNKQTHLQQHLSDLDQQRAQTDGPVSSSDYFWPDTHPDLMVVNHRVVSSHHPHTLSAHMFNRAPDKEYLSHELAEHACRLDRGCQRRDRLNNTFLAHCSRYKLDSLLSNTILMSIMHNSSDVCERILDEFIQLDELINQFDRLFKNLLTRYNCHNGYSVKWTCEDCKKAYKDWLCATSLPYYMNGERIKPCISFCERVEQRCPYLHPITKEQYGGQPVFICKDPNIPFVPEITPDIPYSEPAKCYDLCHLSENITELLYDSLSRYEFGNCPDKGLIAEEVRNDPLYCNPDHFTLGNQNELSNFSKPHLHSSEVDRLDKHISDTEDIPDDRVVTPSRKPVDTNLFDQDEIPAGQHAHLKKLNELKEVLIVYKSQPKTQRFGHH